MIKEKRGQISTEYLILLGFITFIIITFFGAALYSTYQSRDQIKFKELESFARKVISTSERVYYSGAPSKATITVYLPEGINNVTIAQKEIVFYISTASGESSISYISKVNLTGSISKTSGIKSITINANENSASILG